MTRQRQHDGAAFCLLAGSPPLPRFGHASWGLSVGLFLVLSAAPAPCSAEARLVLPLDCPFRRRHADMQPGSAMLRARPHLRCRGRRGRTDAWCGWLGRDGSRLGRLAPHQAHPVVAPASTTRPPGRALAPRISRVIALDMLQDRPKRTARSRPSTARAPCATQTSQHPAHSGDSTWHSGGST